MPFLSDIPHYPPWSSLLNVLLVWTPSSSFLFAPKKILRKIDMQAVVPDTKKSSTPNDGRVPLSHHRHHRRKELYPAPVDKQWCPQASELKERGVSKHANCISAQTTSDGVRQRHSWKMSVNKRRIGTQPVKDWSVDRRWRPLAHQLKVEISDVGAIIMVPLSIRQAKAPRGLQGAQSTR